MFVMKCSRLLRFGSRPSVKLLKAVIGIGNDRRSEVSRQMSGKLTSTMLLFLGRRHRKIGIPNVSYDLPCSVGLLFPNLDVFAVVLDWLTTGVSHRFFVGAAHIGEIAGLRYFNLGRFPPNGSARSHQHFFPGAPNRFPRLCAWSIRRHYDGVLGVV